ncbi:MAG: ERF family protein [Sulfolobaceae archaeon]
MIAEKLIKFHQHGIKLSLDKSVNVGKFGYKYTSLGQLLEKITPVLTEIKLSFYQMIDKEGLITVIIDPEDGDKLSFVTPIVFAEDVQIVGKQITYMRRYTLLSFFGLVGEEDTDAIEAHNLSQKTTNATSNPNTEYATENQIKYFIKLAGAYTIKELGEMINDEKMKSSQITKRIEEIPDTFKKVPKRRMSEIIELLKKYYAEMNGEKNEEAEPVNNEDGGLDEF